MVAFCSVRDCAAGFVPARPQPEAWYRGSGPATGAGYPVAMPGAAIADNVLSPSQLNALARSLLEDAFPVVLVEGEIGNLARPASGHIYLTLKDARAQVRCALFKPKSQRLRFQPREGMRVLARGRLTQARSEEHTSEPQSLMRIPYAV